MSAHIANEAAGLAALPDGDPERVAAYEHAASCPACRKSLGEAERLLALLDGAPQPEPPSEAAMQRAWNAVVAEMDATGERVPARSAGASDSRGHLRAAIALAVSALFVLFDSQGHALTWTVGVECLLIELGTAAVAVGVAARIVENRAGARPASVYAALGAWSAVVAQVYLHFRCHVAHELPHLALFHFGGVLLAALFSGPLGVRLERPSPAR